MKLRVGIVGLGESWETQHRPALRALSDRFDVRAFCADVALLAEQAASDFNAATVDGFRALAARNDVDAVLMLASEWFGPLPILAACDYGKAVYCGATLDLDLERAREVKDRVERSGVAFMAEFPRRHAAATLRLKELIATRLGQPRLLFCHERLRHHKRKQNEAHRRRLHAPAVRAMMELVDWCCYVVDQPATQVTGIRHLGDPSGAEDYRMMSLEFAAAGPGGTDALAQISCGDYLREVWPEAASFRPPADMQVCCEGGVAFVDLPNRLVWFDEAGRHLESLDSEQPVGERLLTQFHRAVTSLVRRSGDLEDAYRAWYVVQSARESYRLGRRLPLDF